MIEAFGGDRWWPLNSQVWVLGTDPDAVLEVLDQHGLGVRKGYPSLADAVEALAPFPFARRDVDFVVGTADGSSAVFASAAPSGGALERFSRHAQLRLSCDCVAASWTPEHRAKSAGAGFDHLRFAALPSDPSLPPGRKTDQLTVQVSDQGRRWSFLRIPPGPTFPAERAYEEPEHYAAKRTAERLPLELLRRYLAAAGVPVDDASYLTGPVLTVTGARRPTSELGWSTMDELRATAGYPAEGIPTDLRARPALDATRG